MRLRLAILPVLTAACVAQDIPLLLNAGGVKQIPGLSTRAFLLPTKCDDGGVIYFRGLFNESADAAPIVRVAPDGSNYTLFQFDNLDDEKLKGVHVLDYTPLDSKLFLLARSVKDQPLVLEYNGDGEFQRAIWLDTQIQPARFGVFQDGSLLVYGSEWRHESGSKFPQSRSALALFDRSGKLLKDLSSGTWQSSTVSPRSVDLALTASAPAGVYVMPYTAAPKLRVISAAGQVERELTLWSPGEEFNPTALRVSGTQALVEFSHQAKGAQNVEERYVAYDLYSGERLRQYKPASNVTGSFACYDQRGEFTFVTVRSGHDAILKASVQ